MPFVDERLDGGKFAYPTYRFFRQTFGLSQKSAGIGIRNSRRSESKAIGRKYRVVLTRATIDGVIRGRERY